jgi:exosortase
MLSIPKNFLSPIIPRTAVVITLSALAGLLFYHDAIVAVATNVLNRGDSSHGVFVPMLALFFLWTIRERIREAPIERCWYGLPLIIAGLLPGLIQQANFQIQFIAYIVLGCGLVLTLLGPALFKLLAFPILFLIAMTPLPEQFYLDVAELSRTVAFAGSVKIITWLGIPHIRSEWHLELPNALLHVDYSCSGIRYLISFVVFGLAYAYLFRETTRGRILTVLATIPISLLASVGRLTIIFVMTYYISPYWSQRQPHIILSWFVFFTVLFGSIFIDHWVQKRLGHRL